MACVDIEAILGVEHISHAWPLGEMLRESLSCSDSKRRHRGKADRLQPPRT